MTAVAFRCNGIYLLAELLRVDIRESTALLDAREDEDADSIALFELLSNRARKAYAETLTEAVQLLCESDPREGWVQMGREAVSILLPDFVWPEVP